MNAGLVHESRHSVRVGLKLSQDASIDTFRRFWRVADEGGFDHCWAFDHLVTVDGAGRPRLLFEGWSLLAAMAAITSRVRIGLLVSGMAYRHPALLAKIAVTVDHLSGGRLEFGVGAGWAPREQEMYGIDVGHLAGRFEEGMEVVKLLWSGQPVDFEGRHYRLRQAVASPPPVQRPHPPIWIGAGGPRMLALAARHADVWNPADGDFHAAREAGLRLVEECHAIGRDPAEIRWSTHLAFDPTDPESTVNQARQWIAAGFTELVLSCTGPDPTAAAEVARTTLLPRLVQLGVDRSKGRPR